VVLPQSLHTQDDTFDTVLCRIGGVVITRKLFGLPRRLEQLRNQPECFTQFKIDNIHYVKCEIVVAR